MTSPRRLTCPCGHTWDYSGVGPLPDDLREVCPLCAPVDAGSVTPDPPGPPLADGDSAVNLPTGRLLAGFEVLGELNRGGMGVIYKARQLGLERIVALKVIAPSRLASRD